MTDTNSPIPFQPADLELLSVDAVSVQLRVSRAFTRVCLECGCPTRRGRLSAAELLHWLFENYQAVRATTGFPPLPPIDGVDATAAYRLRLSNAVITLLEFGESRASGISAKADQRRLRMVVERNLERA